MAFNVKAVMFDLDGTLIHSAPEIAVAINRMLQDLSLPILSLQQVQHHIGEGAQMLIKRSLGVHATADLHERAQVLFFEYYAQTVALSQPYPGVVEGLVALKQKGLRLACVTNKPERFALPLLQASGLMPFFELVLAGDTLPKKKPDPIQLQHICAKFKVLEAEAMLVGDSLTDVKAAHAAGCYIVTVPYGYNQGVPIDESLVDAHIDDLTELLTLID